MCIEIINKLSFGFDYEVRLELYLQIIEKIKNQ